MQNESEGSSPMKCNEIPEERGLACLTGLVDVSTKGVIISLYNDRIWKKCGLTKNTGEEKWSRNLQHVR